MLANLTLLPTVVRAAAATALNVARVHRDVWRFGRHDPRVMRHQRTWARSVCATLGLEVSADGAPLATTPTLFVANHVGYLDILALAALIPNAGFLAKHTLRTAPLIGAAANDAGTLFVDRGSPESRRAAAVAMGRAVKTEGRSLVLFPEGTSRALGKSWHLGAFHTAREFGLQVQPLCLTYDPHLRAAYDLDPFADHLKRFLREGGARLVVDAHPPFAVEDPETATRRAQDWVQDRLRARLEGRGELAAALAHQAAKDRLRAEKKAPV